VIEESSQETPMINNNPALRAIAFISDDCANNARIDNRNRSLRAKSKNSREADFRRVRLLREQRDPNFGRGETEREGGGQESEESERKRNSGSASEGSAGREEKQEERGGCESV